MRGTSTKILATFALSYVIIFCFARSAKAETATVTPTSENTIANILDIKSAKNLPDKEIVTISGIVSALPGMLFAQSFYVEDETSGIQIFSSSKQFPDLILGDKVLVTGELSNPFSERRIKIKKPTDITLIERGAKKLAPTSIKLAQCSEDYEGRYVKVEGTIKEPKDDFIGDDDTDLLVRIKIQESSKIIRPSFKLGDRVEIAGIVSQYKNEYRILPINSQEVKIITPEKPLNNQDSTSISKARGQTDGTDIEVLGIVTVLPGVLSSQYFYIQDESSGIQVYCHDKSFPSLRNGDRLKVRGNLTSAFNERRLKINRASDIIMIGRQNEAEPIQANIADIGEKNEGQYVKINGIIKESKGSEFIVQDKSTGSNIKVVIRKSTNIIKPKMHKGDEVLIAGIVSQYKDEYRILPFKQEDVKILSSTQLPKAGSDYLVTLPLSLVIYFFLWTILQKVKKKQRMLASKSPVS